MHAETAAAIREDDAGLESAEAVAWVRHMMLAGKLDEARAMIPMAIQHAATNDHAADSVHFLEQIVVGARTHRSASRRRSSAADSRARAMGVCRSIHSRALVRQREMRDFTVPTGQSSSAAIAV